MRCDSYAFGNCTRGACDLAPWVPDRLGDGGDWAINAVGRGYVVTMVPTVGAVVSYCRGNGYSVFGHVGVVVDVAADGRFLVREMNYAEFNAYDTRWSTMGDVCGFILPPGVSPGQAAPGFGSATSGGQAEFPAPVTQAWENVRVYTSHTADQLANEFLAATLAAESVSA